MSLDTHGYRELIREALPVAQDADTSFVPEPGSLFTPQSHRQALDPDVTIVRGARGVGKTVWFKALQDGKLRHLAADYYQIQRLDRIQALPGYGTTLSPSQYPGQRTLGDLLSAKLPPEDIWTTVVLNSLQPQAFTSRRRWEERVQWTRENPEDAEALLASADNDATSSGATKLFLFDALDRLHSERTKADLLAVGIFKLALQLRTTTRNLRVKVFVRHDMFDSALLSFADASKISANAADLLWSPTNLYGLFFNQLGNVNHPLAGSFRNTTETWKNENDRFVPPQSVVGDQAVQQKIMNTIAGKFMGRNHRRGYTYTWLPNHLADGKGQASPRSFLNAIQSAINHTVDKFADHEYPIHWEGIRQGVQRASQTRVGEINEDILWVRTAIEPLRGRQVPIEEEEVITRWTESNLLEELDAMSADLTDDNDPVPTGPRNDNYAGLIQELIELGVMTRRSNGKLDLPDVYRIAFDIGRRGGVPRIQS